MKRPLSSAVWTLAFALPLGACAPANEEPNEQPSVAQERAAVTSFTWTKLAQPFLGGNSPTYVALLTDGRVLVSGSGNDNSWYTLTPDSSGSYANGSWTQVQSSFLGHQFGPSFVLRDGRFFICGGEYNNDPTEELLHAPGTDRAHCEIFDPVTNLWTSVPDMPQTVADTAAAELADGRVLLLSHSSTNTYLFDPTKLGPGQNPWSLGASYQTSVVDTEGDCQLLQDASLFCGKSSFARYVTGSPDQWVSAVTSAGSPASNAFSPAPKHEEIGALLLMHTGKVLVLGATQQNALYTPPKGTTADSWSFVADTPMPYNHGDAPATVEVNGNALTVVTNDPDGEGQAGDGVPALYEFDASTPAGAWNAIPAPFGTSSAYGSGNRMRLLNLPQASTSTAQILLTGVQDGSMWIYGSPNTPAASWRPTLTRITGPTSGVYTLQGMQLNGLTSGAVLGDDAKMLTNYPLVSLTSGGQTYYARSFNFDQMSPRATTTISGSCSFTLPPTLPNGTYTVHVSANGVDGGNTLQLSVSETHVSGLSGPLFADLGTVATWTVTLSNPAPAGGTVVTLASSGTNVATVPASITVPAGATSTTFPVSVLTTGVTSLSAVTRSAQAFTPVVAQFGWTIRRLTGADVVYGAQSTNLTVTLSSVAPPHGVFVNLTSSNPQVATVPSSVRVGARSFSATFPVTRVSDGLATITASVGNATMSRTVQTNAELSIGDMSFFKCADENGSCAFSGFPARYMAFGAGSSFNYQAATGASVPCTTTQFGDPDVGITKACYFSSYVLLGSEGAALSLPSRMNVAFGANGHFAFKDMSGNFTCDQATIGNPNVGGTRACYAGPSYYEFVTGEGGSFSVRANTPVAYGGGGRFFYRIMSGSVSCNNDTFGDPAGSVTKACYRVSEPYITDEFNSFSTSGLTDTLYGTGTNDNFIRSTATSGSCTNSFFGGDPDPTRTKHCYGL